MGVDGGWVVGGGGVWRAQDGGRGMEGRVFPGRSVSICDILIDILLSLERMLRLKNKTKKKKKKKKKKNLPSE